MESFWAGDMCRRRAAILHSDKELWYNEYNMTPTKKPLNLIKLYSTAMVDGLVGKVKASSPLQHKLTKGELRELFVTNLLSPFLTSQFDIGSGIIINQKEEQSDQTDIIIYDNRILPFFIKEQHIGVFPAECVVGVIEVKTNLRKDAVIRAEASARKLCEVIYNPASNIYRFNLDLPLCATIAFYGNGSFLKNNDRGRVWLNSNCRHILYLCLVGKLSWIRLRDSGWVFSERIDNYEETKRFIAVYLDNLRTISELRLNHLSQFAHKDWLSVYIRDQNLFEENNVIVTPSEAAE